MVDEKKDTDTTKDNNINENKDYNQLLSVINELKLELKSLKDIPSIPKSNLNNATTDNIHQRAKKDEENEEAITKKAEELVLEGQLLTKLKGDALLEYEYIYADVLKQSKGSFNSFVDFINKADKPDFNNITTDFLDLFFKDKDNKIITENVNELLSHKIAYELNNFYEKPQSYTVQQRRELLKDVLLDLDKYVLLTKKNINLNSNNSNNNINADENIFNVFVKSIKEGIRR